MSRKIWRKVSGGLMILGVSILLFPFVKLGHSHMMSDQLFEKANTHFQELDQSSKMDTDLVAIKENISNNDYQTGLYPNPASNKLGMFYKNGEIIGKLEIPSLGISEAILEGTGQQELAKAPGHLKGSVFPGQIGTSIIAAHNATTFRYLDRLVEGMKFTITTEQGIFTFSVTGNRILNVNDSFPDRAYPSIALETCYPLDALHLTNQRLFVEAALVKSTK